jgi:ubiquinone/menaquinone biosynthesis C-methylase UbiE
MRFYDTFIVPRIINVACGGEMFHPLRRRVCEGLSGEVVEIGFGSGHNVPFYPPAITTVRAVEPADLGWKLAAERVQASPVPVRRSGLDGQALQLPDASCDAALSTWSLCTIPDPVTALHEVRRVLRPGGFLRFLEHGLAPDESVRRWQRRLDPLEKAVAGGCRFTRQIPELLQEAGFTITELDVFYQEGVPRFSGAYSLGTAAV